QLSKLDVNASLKDGSRGAAGSLRGNHLSAILVTGEIALAVVLLAGAGILIRSFLKIHTADTGVRTANLLMGAITAAKPAFLDQLKTRLEALPGVESAAIASRFPTEGVRRVAYEIAGAQPIEEKLRPGVSALVISPGYFRTLG